MIDLPEDPTLDELRAALAPLVARNAAFDGWRKAAVVNAAEQAGVNPAIAELAFTGGAVAMIDAWFAVIDMKMAEALPLETLATMKIRQRITALVEARLNLLARDRESLRRALAILAMPQNLPRSAQLGWRAADVMWRLAGDVATDYNHYSKRTILGGVYLATLLTFIDDDSEGYTETRAFLGRRIDGIMRFEKAKASLLPSGDRRLSLSRFIGRLRYPAI
ncbi:COQ9 family protein [Sphingobium sp. SCG-1]|uniref:COQ9 family protein n=1 Tax=Sphingobium sp. SCG-1 TaxID=2072936 RepID=UPI000CD685A2|nr:COQ9 family protein [Sphingobium sp. SCG-1]AUW59988.1 COQ9 family protein [Sphingobium sp. SCG-1]